MAVGTGSPTVPYQREVRWMLQAAMVLFIYTVVIGILNGLDLVTFERKPLLAHLHIGTLGWITMAVFAASLTLFGQRDPANQNLRRLALAAPVVAAAYNVAFLTTTGIARPILGTLMMLVILALAAWAFRQAAAIGRASLSVPQVGMLAGLATSVIGAVFGILLGLMISNPDLDIPEAAGDAHPAAMVVGFLIPVGMAFAEWTLRGAAAEGQPASRAGWLQIGLPFLGGVAVVLGLLLDALPLVMLSLPLELAGLAIFLWRVFPDARRTSWLAAADARHGVAAAIYLVVNIGVFVYLISNYSDDFEAAPRRLLLALDHSIFVGVLTMSIIPFIARQSSAPRSPMVDHLVFWGVTAGVGGFVVGLLSDTDALIRVATPVLGAAILFAIAVHLRALGDPRAAFRTAREPVTART